MKKLLWTLVLLLPTAAIAEEEKHHEDPTKVVTKVGAGYNDEFYVSGSIGLDEARKINVRLNEDASEWRIGGSWLFDAGIVNFNFSKSEYDDGSSKNNYSVGTFIPLSYFDFTPGGWQIFPMAGYSYNDGEFRTENTDTVEEGDYVFLPATSHGGYLGAFALKPLTEKWSLMSFGGGSIGSDDYSGYWYGIGTSFKISGQQSINAYAFATDDDFGSDEKIGISYTYEFDGFILGN